MPSKCSPYIAPSGVPCIRPPSPQGQKRTHLPVMTVNGVAPDKSGNVVVGIPALEDLKGKVVQLENDDHVYSLLKTIAEALGMQVGAGGSWTGTSYVSLGAFATKDTIGPDDLTPELKAQLKGDKGDAGPAGQQGPRGAQGVQGERGERGPQGERGDTGDQGPQGLQGPQGAPLVVTRTQETSDPGGYNVVMLSDGTTLNIRNGSAGPAGQKGEQGERGEKGDTGAKGDKGEKGDKGADGTVAFDYLTEAQKAQLKGDKGDPGELPAIDSELDLTSSNPVMNSAIAAELLNLRAFVASQYYPEGNVKDASELTAGIKYNFADDGTERTATVKPFLVTSNPENDNSSLVGRVVIPPFVDANGNPYVFDDGTRYKVVGVSGGNRDDNANVNANLTSLIAPNTVTTIETNAFYNCAALLSVSLPAAMTVGEYASSRCTALLSVSLPAAMTIGTGAFTHCHALASVSLPVATSIGVGAFTACYKLASVSLPFANTVGDRAFSRCTLMTSVDFGDTPRSSVPKLGPDLFYEGPTSCKIIVPDAQYDEWVAAPNWIDLVTAGYTFLRHSEWGYARKYEVGKKDDKPATFTAGNLVEFDSDGNLTDSGVSKYDFKTLSPFEKYYPEGNVMSEDELTSGVKYDAPDTTARTITVKPFCNTGNPENDNSDLTGSVVIPPFVDEQGNPYISDDGTRYKVVGVSGGGDRIYPGPGPISIIAPSTVTSIGGGAFNYCYELTSVSIPAATIIGHGAFFSCSGLKSVSIPAVTTIENDAFYGCSLRSVSFPLATTIGVGVFSDCNDLTSVSIPAATTIGDHAFFGCNDLTSVSLPAATTIGTNAFADCSSLTSVSLPAATTIGSGAFSSCTNLGSVSLPAATAIGEDAFRFCKVLASVSLPVVTSIGNGAFRYCDMLELVYLPAATTIGYDSFSNCKALASVSLPVATAIRDSAFERCVGLASVNFGDTPRSSVPTLGNGVFSSVPTSCNLIVPDAQYDEWVAAPGWSDLVTSGYTFTRHSDW